MKQLISLPASAQTLAEYPPEHSLAASCRAFGCDGLEIVWSGEPLPAVLPQTLHIGYHLTFYADWLDFWNNNRPALLRKFGSEQAWFDFYGGADGKTTLLAAYREDLRRAVHWGAAYVVFHVSDVSLEEGYTYHWQHRHQEVIDASIEIINLLLDGQNFPFAFLVENQWWPGFTFTQPALTARLLRGIRYPNKGIMLDLGHLMNTNPALTSQVEGAAYLHQMLDAHGKLCRYVRGVHFHQSLSGEYLRQNAYALPRNFPSDYPARFTQNYAHILRIDTHQPWTDPAICSVLRRIAPEYLVHELSAPHRTARDARLRVQTQTLQRGWNSF